MKLKIYSAFLKTLMIGAILFLNTNLSFGQAPPWLFAESGGGSAWDEAHSVSTDASGNIIVVGYFSSPFMILGSDTLFNTDTVNGSGDIFVVKYDPLGNVLWAKSAGGNSDEEANSVIADASGNIFVTGNFRSDTIIFGSDTLTNDSAGWYYNLFLVKFDSNGNELWVRTAEGRHDCEGRSVTVDVAGNILIAGIYSSPTMIFGPDTLFNAFPGYTDSYFVKFDANGNLLLTGSVGGNNNDDAHSIATDLSGNFILEGTYTSDTIIFDSDTLFNYSAGSLAEIFIAKYDVSGNLLWVKHSTGTGDDQSTAVTTDTASNIIVTGTFSGAMLIFGSDTLSMDTTIAGNYGDIFLVKFNSNGNVLWAESAGGVSYDQANSIKTDAFDNIIIAGYFQSPSIIFGNDTLSNDTAVGTEEMFVVKYDVNGNERWAKSADGNGHENAKSVTIDVSGNIMTTGRFESTVTFGADIINSIGQMNMFVAKLDTESTLGMNRIVNLNHDISLFPNPAEDHFSIDLKSYQKKVEVTITDVSGKIIYSVISSEGKTLIVNTTNISEGIYFVRISSEDFIGTGRIVIAR